MLGLVILYRDLHHTGHLPRSVRFSQLWWRQILKTESIKIPHTTTGWLSDITALVIQKKKTTFVHFITLLYIVASRSIIFFFISLHCESCWSICLTVIPRRFHLLVSSYVPLDPLLSTGRLWLPCSPEPISPAPNTQDTSSVRRQALSFPSSSGLSHSSNHFSNISNHFSTHHHHLSTHHHHFSSTTITTNTFVIFYSHFQSLHPCPFHHFLQSPVNFHQLPVFN